VISSSPAASRLQKPWIYSRPLEISPKINFRPPFRAERENRRLGRRSIGESLRTLSTRALRTMTPSTLSLLVLTVALGEVSSARAQTSEAVVANSLPDAPEFQSTGQSPNERSQTARAGTASISGTVESPNGDLIEGAKVSATSLGSPGSFTRRSGSNGEFSVSGLEAGVYTVSVTGDGWGTYVSPRIDLKAGEARILTGVVLQVANATTEIRVNASTTEIAEEEIRIAEQQRVMGVLPNFYTAFDWNAPPLGSKQKYKLAFRSVTDPVSFLGVGFIAGVEQANDSYSGYGQGAQGYGKRFGAAFATDFASRMLDSAVFPSIFHQDPRYFYKGTGSKKSRVLYAVSRSVLTRNDEGSTVPNYSRILGSLSAGGLSNLYFPSKDRGFGLTISNWLLETAGNAGNNVVREFLLKRLTTHVPKDADAQP
jgi:hypothetical protein